MLHFSERIAEGRLADIAGVPCSREVGEGAARVGIPLSTLDDHSLVDLTIDGAAEIDPKLDLVQGAGCGFLRKKVVGQTSRRVIVVADASKPTPVHGSRRAVPAAVVKFGWRAQVPYLKSIGGRVQL